MRRPQETTICDQGGSVLFPIKVYHHLPSGFVSHLLSQEFVMVGAGATTVEGGVVGCVGGATQIVVLEAGKRWGS